MTPSTTPTPTTNTCFYRDAEFKGETVQVLVDAFGRMLVQDDDGTIGGIAWNEDGVTTDFETNGDYAAQFNAIRTAFGESDVITEMNDDNVTFTDDEGNSVLLIFDDANKRFIPIVSEIENGTPNMFKRTLNVNGTDVTFVCDADGKVCYFNDGYFLLVENGDEFSPSSDGSTLNALYTAAGGSVEVTVTESSDTNMKKVANGNYFFVLNQDGYVTFGSVTNFIYPQLEGGGHIIPVSIGYVSGEGLTIEDSQVVRRETLSKIPVVIDNDGAKHVIRCTVTQSKYYGQYAGKNVPGWDQAWWGGIDADGVGAPVETGYLEADSFTTWLFDHGLNGQIYWDGD